MKYRYKQGPATFDIVTFEDLSAYATTLRPLTEGERFYFTFKNNRVVRESPSMFVICEHHPSQYVFQGDVALFDGTRLHAVMTEAKFARECEAAELPFDVDALARLAHEVNRAYCASIGDDSQVPWEDAPGWQRESSRVGVRGIINGEIVNPGDAHRSWLAEKERDGWTYGPVKDAEARTHHCMVPFESLPPEQQAKDHLFVGTVTAAISARYGDRVQSLVNRAPAGQRMERRIASPHVVYTIPCDDGVGGVLRVVHAGDGDLHVSVGFDPKQPNADESYGEKSVRLRSGIGGGSNATLTHLLALALQKQADEHARVYDEPARAAAEGESRG